MTALDLLWHRWQKLSVPRVLPISFVDNLELVSDRLGDLFDAADSLFSFCHSLDLEVDLPSLYAWSSSSVGRRLLVDKGYKVSLGERDLGGQVTYCHQHRNKVLTDRIQQVVPFFEKLRRSSLTVATKKVNLKQVLWPRALHGCEAVTLGDQHVQKLRCGAMKALKWDRAGATPLVRLALLHVDVDPGWFQLWRVIAQFRHQCQRNPVVKDWWVLDSKNLGTSQTFGPFGKLVDLLHEIGLSLDSEFRLWFSEIVGNVCLLSSPVSLLKKIIMRSYHDHVALKLQQRPGFEDLDGFYHSIATTGDHRLTPQQLEQLMIVRDGSFFTDQHKAKWDTRISGQCVSCQVPDTKVHRYTVCSRYDVVRRQHLELFEHWDDMPHSFQQHGLVPENPWETPVWEAFLALPDKTQDFRFQPTETIWHVFTDGTVADPTDEFLALAAWATVVADQGPLSCGPLQGTCQTIL